MDEWRMCTRCGLVPGRARGEDSDTFLCDDCERRVDKLGDAASSLAHTLMRWGRQQEWQGADPDVLLEAVGLSFALFESRILTGMPLAGSAQLLHSAKDGDGLELTLSSSPTAVWSESFGTWDSKHRRVPFLTETEGSIGPIDVMLHFWDKGERSAGSLGFWSADDQVLADFAEATQGGEWGVPWNVVRVAGIKENSPQALEDLCAIADSLGFFPSTGRRDAARGTATIELAGDMSGEARELLVETISRSLACHPGAVSVRPGGLDAGA